LTRYIERRHISKDFWKKKQQKVEQLPDGRGVKNHTVTDMSKEDYNQKKTNGGLQRKEKRRAETSCCAKVKKYKHKI